MHVQRCEGTHTMTDISHHRFGYIRQLLPSVDPHGVGGPRPRRDAAPSARTSRGDGFGRLGIFVLVVGLLIGMILVWSGAGVTVLQDVSPAAIGP